MATDVTVRAPQESGRTPYLTQEALAQIRTMYEQLGTMYEAGKLGPGNPLAAAAGNGEAAGAAVSGESLGSVYLPEAVRRGYYTPQEWTTIASELAAAAQRARSMEFAPANIQEARANGGSGNPILGDATRAPRAHSLLSEQGFHLPSGRLVRLSEAYGTQEFPVLLRSGLRTILFDSFAQTPTIWQDICQRVDSNKPEEYWSELSRLGLLGLVGESEEYPAVGAVMLPVVRIGNAKRGGILDITEEMIRFDQTAQILQLPRDRGRAAAYTVEDAFATVIETSGNYTRTSADNDIGANTAANAFSPGNFITAYKTLATMFEARSGRYLGVVPDTLICGVGVYFAAIQLFRSPQVQSGEDAAGAAGGIGGVPSVNPLAGVVKNIYLTPYIPQYNWVLGVKGQGLMYQEVEPMTLAEQVAPGSDGPFVRDVFRYKLRVWFGVGFQDDRYWYLGAGTTAADWT